MNDKKEISPDRSFLDGMTMLTPSNLELKKDVAGLESVLKQMADQNYRAELIRAKRDEGLNMIKLRHESRLRAEAEQLQAERVKIREKIEADRKRDPSKTLLNLQEARMKYDAMSPDELKETAAAFMTDRLDLDPDHIQELSRALKGMDAETHNDFRKHVNLKRAQEWELRTPEGLEIERRLRFVTAAGEGEFSVAEGQDAYDLGTVGTIEQLISL